MRNGYREIRVPVLEDDTSDVCVCAYIMYFLCCCEYRFVINICRYYIIMK